MLFSTVITLFGLALAAPAAVTTSVKTITITSNGKTSTVYQTSLVTKVVTTTRRSTTTVRSTAVAKAVTTTVKATSTRRATTTAKAATTTVRPTTTTTRATTSVTAASNTAPTTPNLYPRLIVPVIAGQGAQGTKYFVTVTSTTKSDLLFDIAPASGYKTCTLVGRFPVGGSPTSSGAYGSAQIQAELLATNINTSTSSSNQPAGKTDLGTRAAGTATNGANAVYASFPVTAGQSYSIALTAVSGSLNLFEDYNAPVVGYTLNCV